jgi:ABC-type uncharacterized transport system involved in gliding motility auxiliary subunit
MAMLADLRKKESLEFILTMLAVVLIAIASNIYWTRADLTLSRAHTLSKASRSLHQEIPETVRISYFASKILADRHPGPGAIEDFLRELEAVSRGRIRVRIVDPTKNPSEPESFGLVPQQMQVMEQSEQRLALVYTGIVIEYLDRHETIPVILSTESIEYEIVRAIRTVVGDIKLVAGLLAGDKDKSIANDYQVLAGGLKRAGYETREIQRGLVIDDDVKVLFVLGNSALDRYDTAFIDAYIMRGGRVFFAVKGVDINAEYGLTAATVAEGGLLGALEAYGFVVARELVLDQSSLTVPFQTQNTAGAYQIQYVRYPHWVALDARYTDTDNPMTARFQGLDLYWPSPMSLKPIPGVKYSEAAKTSPKSWLQTRDFAARPEDQSRYALERSETTGQYLVAASATGTFPSAFAAGDPPFREGAAPAPLPVASVSPETRMVVVSSADFLTDLMRMSDSMFNASFALTAADWLVSSDDLLALRTKAVLDTRLNKIREPKTRAVLVTLSYIVTLALVPLAIIMYGLVRSAKRNKRERESRAAIGGDA